MFLFKVDLEKATEIQITLDGFSTPGSIQVPGGSLTGLGGSMSSSTLSASSLQQTSIATQRVRLLDQENRPLHLEASVAVGKNGGLQVDTMKFLSSHLLLLFVWFFIFLGDNMVSFLDSKQGRFACGGSTRRCRTRSCWSRRGA